MASVDRLALPFGGSAPERTMPQALIAIVDDDETVRDAIQTLVYSLGSITGYPNNSVRARAMKAGAIGFLSKPSRPDYLIECVERALKAV
jgi:FixJ family two-component response regulator